MKKVAIYGGSFNPIHLAHVKLADYAVYELELDELYFMPTFVSPFKQDKKMAERKDRLAMIESVLDYNPKFKLSDYEIDNENVSYTIKTLDYFSKELDAKLYYVVGFDALLTLDTWYRGEEILNKYSLITAKRPDSSEIEALTKINSFIRKYNSKIHILDMPEMDISSSDIRNRIKNGKSIKELVLPATEEYIIEHNLYRD